MDGTFPIFLFENAGSALIIGMDINIMIAIGFNREIETLIT